VSKLELHPRAMTIAGSDSGGGAGIQADLKTFAAFGVYGTSAITAITAQNTRQVSQVLSLPLDLIAAQIDAIVLDIGTSAVKTGMLSNTAIIETVKDKIEEHNLRPLVIDPVMVAKSGDYLLHPDAIRALQDFLSLATIVTPNVPEAEALSGRRITDLDDAKGAAEAIHALGPNAVVIKGGHFSGDQSTDLLFDGENFTELSTKRIITTSTHGTGCTFASAVTAGLAKGLGVEQAVANAKDYVTKALHYAFPIGEGHGPLNHFYHWWD